MNLTRILNKMRVERSQLQKEVDRLDETLTVLESLSSRGRRRKPRRISAAARRRIAAAQKARWAKWRAKHGSSRSPHR